MIAPDRIIYIGDGGSDVHVMPHLNRLGGLTIAVSENPYITEIARRTILGDNALSILIPILEEAAGWNGARIRQFFESHGFALREWSKMRTDNVILSPAEEVGV
jgi:predicted HAD superfamily phosphohydrolase